MKARHIDGRWTDFPSPPTDPVVWKWWWDVQKSYLRDARGFYYTTRNQSQLIGHHDQRENDILVKSSTLEREPAHDSVALLHDWADVRVVGEQRVSDTDAAANFWQLTRCVRHVFNTQPTRRFVHGFLLLGTIMELYVFDRSGAYQAKRFDIHAEPRRFIRVLTGYVLMSDEELGLDTFVEQKNKRKSVMLEDDCQSEAAARTSKKVKTTFEIEPRPITVQRAVVCRGTSCYSTTDGKAVVKFSWTSAKRPSEVTHLKRARERGVKGVAQILGHHEIASIAELRKGLTFTHKHHIGVSRATGGAASRSELAGSFGEQSPHASKYKPVDLGSRARAESRQDSETPKLSQKILASYDPQVEASQAEETEVDNSHRTPVAALLTPGDERYRNRVLSCIAVYPAGQPLESVKTVTDLLRCLRDAIKAHRSLFEDGKILHRDVSINNIIITDPEKADGFHGTLIDLDMAVVVDEPNKIERSGADGPIGTLKYMAIEVLEKAFCEDQRTLDQTYRHDLESFFYVFLDLCINIGRPHSKSDLLVGWYVGSYARIAKTKASDMSNRYFEDTIVAEFLPRFDSLRGLARELREVLFGKGELDTGTPDDPPPLYSMVIGAFNDALESCEKLS